MSFKSIFPFFYVEKITLRCPIGTSNVRPGLYIRIVAASKRRLECNNPDLVSALQLNGVDPDDLYDHGIISLPHKKTPSKQ